jgi:WXXGXW repeat (2 copies)
MVGLPRFRQDFEMGQFRNAIAALIVAMGSPPAFMALASAQTCACAPGGGYVIQADEPPPPLPEYDQPPLPAPGYYWTPGYWAWNNYDYYWVPGVWVEPPEPGLLWTPGYWAFVGGVYAFRPGYWGPRVGFYGGVNYGFGYGGAGYEGGRWDNGRFFYNSNVNNLGAVRVGNVYSQPVAVNGLASRASFNGGPGGLAVKPTNEELLAEKEPHVPPSRLQVDQARAAGMRGEQFVSTNHGKPGIAATARPGEFQGKGVIPAKAAGAAAQAAPAPGGNAEPETKEKPPAVEKLMKPGAAPSAPRIEEKPPAVEKLMKPEAAPNPPKLEEKPPGAEKMVKPENPPNPPKVEEKRPVIEKPLRPEPPSGAQKALERPPVPLERRPAQPVGKPEAKECGRPGLPPCPR